MSDTSQTTPPGTSRAGNYLTAQDRPELNQSQGNTANRIYRIDPRAHFSLGLPPYPWRRYSLEQDDELGHSQTSEESSMSSSLSKDDIRNQAKNRKVGLGKKLKVMFEKFFFKREQCTSCLEDFRSSKLIPAPCEHHYCPQCVRKMAVLALRKKIRFQIQCCDQIIPTKQVVATLSTRSKRLYSARVDEEAVPAAERWYCAQAGCRQWIPSKYLKPGSKSQRCPHCRTASCSQCRDLAHADHPCFEDPGLADVLEIARRRHWQRCPSCHAMVERTGGCPHMRCRCGVDFCYACGEPYPGCQCRDSDEVHPYDDCAVVGMDHAIRLFLAATSRGDNGSDGEDN